MKRALSVAATFALFGFLLCTRPARSQEWLGSPGAPGGTIVTVGHATVRLPPGDWQPMSQFTDVPQQAGGDSLAIETRWFAQRSRDQVAAIVSISSNQTRSPRGWSPDRICGARNVVFFENRSESSRNFDCLVVSHRLMEPGDNPSEASMARFEKMRAFGRVPHQMIAATFAQASGSRLDFVRLSIYFNPMLAGFVDDPGQTWLGSDWHQTRISADHLAFVDKVVRWARAYRDTVAGSF